MARRGSKVLAAAEVERHLLQLEGLGVLDRDICYMPMMTDDEDSGVVKAPRVIPPRLFYVPTDYTLVHCVGSMEFYDMHPEYVYGGLSYECYILEYSPRHLDNYYAMEDTYRKAGAIPEMRDIVSQRQTRPPPVTRKEYMELSKRNRQMIKDRIAAAEATEQRSKGLSLVKG